uniref:Vacuolar-sorting protein SNF8 n=1 Tax=Biomphalaria glabrata TaxID=6526 RepID=A0A2C9K3I5_BIOGL
MSRRPAGIAAIKNKNLAQTKYKDKGSELAESQFVQMGQQMEMFKNNLEDFAAKHREDIRKDPEFRLQFQEMCASIGVDPLASSKGFWAKMLGVGDFYYELGIQIVEVCLATSKRNGGLISIEDLRRKVEASRGRNSQQISIDDLLQSIKKLKILGNGFSVHKVGNSFLVQSIPGELTLDHTVVLQQAQEHGHVTLSGLIQTLNWEESRGKRALDFLVKECLGWVDDQSGAERSYWFPSLIPDFTTTLT